MKLSTAARVSVASVALLGAGACAGEGYYYSTVPATSTVVVQSTRRWQDPTYFAARVHDRVARLEAQVRTDVMAGRLQTQAIDELVSRKNQLEGVLAQVGADGVVTAPERDYVRGLVRDMWSVNERYATGATSSYTAPYGGGPGAYQPPYDDSWWY
jgi:hypothetical protein